jgi:hypothetical protein
VSDDPWIIVPSWRKFQHYTDRDPPWIKLYTELGSNDDWLELTDAECGLLVRIWVEYARSRGVLRASRVPAAALQKNRRRGLERLVQAGFIHLSASKPLALAHARARAKKKSEEEEKDLPKSLQDRATPKRYRTGYRMVRGTHGVSYIPDPNGTDPLPTGWQG